MIPLNHSFKTTMLYSAVSNKRGNTAIYLSTQSQPPRPYLISPRLKFTSYQFTTEKMYLYLFLQKNRTKYVKLHAYLVAVTTTTLIKWQLLANLDAY